MNFNNLTFDFKGKNVLVTGGSKGIGRGVVEAFVVAGADVYYASRSPIKNDIKATHIKTDLSKEEEIQDLFKELDKRCLVDVVINAAAINYCKTIENISLGEWDEVINLNLRSIFIICKEAIKRMKKSGYGKIVNISSIAGRYRSIVSGVHYVASKAAIIGLTRQLAYEVAEFNINVNTVCPSQTQTDMLNKSMSYKQIKKLEESIPLKRIATVKEQVGPILFLCSDAASYMTGTFLDINGGQI